MFIVFDGIDGSGKTSQADLFKAHCESRGLSVAIHRDPGGTPAGTKIREILLDKATPLTPIGQALLFAAARSELAVLIREELDAFDVVISDRWLLSTLCYQSHLQGVNRKFVMDLYTTSVGFKPDLYVIIDIDAQTALRRKAGKGPCLGKCTAPKDRERELTSEADRFESMGVAKQEKIRQGFMQESERLQRAYWSDFIVIDGNYSPDVLAKLIRDEMSQRSQVFAKLMQPAAVA